jgi:hypothetical protein
MSANGLFDSLNAFAGRWNGENGKVNSSDDEAGS